MTDQDDDIVITKTKKVAYDHLQRLVSVLVSSPTDNLKKYIDDYFIINEEVRDELEFIEPNHKTHLMLFCNRSRKSLEKLNNSIDRVRRQAEAAAKDLEAMASSRGGK